MPLSVNLNRNTLFCYNNLIGCHPQPSFQSTQCSQDFQIFVLLPNGLISAVLGRIRLLLSACILAASQHLSSPSQFFSFSESSKPLQNSLVGPTLVSVTT